MPIILSAALSLLAATRQAEATTASPQPSPAQLVLTLETSRSAVVLYEPVPLAYRVTNPTTDVITSSLDLGGIEFLVAGPDGKAVAHPSSAILGNSVRQAVKHEPGSNVRRESDLNWRGPEGPFPAPGVYEVRVRVYAGGRPPVYLESEPLNIEVREPSQVDAKAIASFASVGGFERLLRDGATAYCEGRDGPACFDDLRRFVDEHGDSAYGPKILRNLADSVATGSLGIQPQDEIGAQLYKRFLERWPTHPNAPSVMYCLAMTLDQAGRSGEAAQVITEFEKRFPDQQEKAHSLRTNTRSGQTIPPQPN